MTADRHLLAEIDRQLDHLAGVEIALAAGDPRARGGDRSDRRRFGIDLQDTRRVGHRA